jgi:hypothetical protein
MNGYIQANILDKDRGLKFGTLAAEQITMELVSLGVATGGHYSNSMIAVVIYWGLYNNSFVKRQELDVTFEQVCDWVDENWYNKELEQTFTDIVKCYEESKQSKLVIEKLKENVEEVKKKTLTLNAEMDGNI